MCQKQAQILEAFFNTRIDKDAAMSLMNERALVASSGSMITAAYARSMAAIVLYQADDRIVGDEQLEMAMADFIMGRDLFDRWKAHSFNEVDIQFESQKIVDKISKLVRSLRFTHNPPFDPNL